MNDIDLDVFDKLEEAIFVFLNACAARPALPVTAPDIASVIKPSAPPFNAALPAPFPTTC